MTKKWTTEEHQRLLEVAVRRLQQQPWSEVAAEMGWHSKQAAQQWAMCALDRAARAGVFDE